MSIESNDERFFIGWEAKRVGPVSAFLKKVALLFVTLGIAIAVGTTSMQKTVSSGTFDFGNMREFSGILVKSPTPMLIADTESEEERIYYLVAPMKYGFPVAVAAQYHLQHVTLRGTHIGDELEAMIEVVKGSVAASGQIESGTLQESLVGEITLRGEIVDSKCHLGVMNPGRFKPHRACAIQCIAGGIPPILVTRASSGALSHYLLVGTDGSAINARVIDFVAEPVDVTGILKIIGDRQVVFLDPATVTRL